MSDLTSPLPRLALVTGGLNLGGATTFLINLAGELVRRSVAVKVFSLHDHNPHETDFARQNIPLEMESRRNSIFEDRLEDTMKAVGAFRATHLVACLGPESFESLRYAPEGVHRIGMIQSDDPNVYRALDAYAEYLDGVGAVSREIGRKCAAWSGLSRVPARYLPYGVPIPADLPPHDFRGATPIRILYIGRLYREQKRVHLFPQIYRRLIANGTRFQWTIAGEGPECEVLQQTLLSDPGSHEVSFAGKVEYRDVPGLLGRHDIFLLASDYEGLPLSLLEAMGQGLVPVVSDLASGMREVVDESCGVLVPPDQTDSYADAITVLAGNPERMGALSCGAHERVKRNYSVAAMADRWMDFLTGTRGAAAAWPSGFAIKPPLGVNQPLHFSTAARPVRRLVKKLRGGR